MFLKHCSSLQTTSNYVFYLQEQHLEVDYKVINRLKPSIYFELSECVNNIIISQNTSQFGVYYSNHYFDFFFSHVQKELTTKMFLP